MPAYNFRAEFTELVEKGGKRQTIRRRRKRPTRVGDRLILYTGMRTASCRKLAEAVCKCLRDISIFGPGQVSMDGWPLFPDEIEALAEADGFLSAYEFIDFFRRQYGLPFEGVIVMW